MQQFNRDVQLEKEIKHKIHEYEALGKNLTEISKKSTAQVMVRKELIIFVLGSD